jgi:hypothetical protein
LPRFDRYLLSQLLALFGFFSLVLVAVYWVNRAVGLFDQLIGDGQSALVFVEFSLLTLPNVIRLVLPVSAFAACLYAVNRLMQESELVVMQATGFSPWRLARPIVYFGLCVWAMQLVLTNILVPMSQSRLSQRTAEVNENVTARFLTPGRFMHPASGVTTLHPRDHTPGRVERPVPVRRTRPGRDGGIYRAAGADRARRGRSAAGHAERAGPAQAQDGTARLSVTRFADFTLDLAGIVGGDGTRRAVRERTVDARPAARRPCHPGSDRPEPGGPAGRGAQPAGAAAGAGRTAARLCRDDAGGLVALRPLAADRGWRWAADRAADAEHRRFCGRAAGYPLATGLCGAGRWGWRWRLRRSGPAQRPRRRRRLRGPEAVA